jgi:hypothetical protein
MTRRVVSLPETSVVDAALRERLDALIEEGWEIWVRFDDVVRRKHFHPFVAADYDKVLQALLPLRVPGSRFLEWGSATGVVTIIADLLGFEAYGIELDARLVEIARELAKRYASRARFAEGSFLPAGYTWKPSTGDGRLGTIGQGPSGYPQLEHPLEDFDVVYAYPWGGEETMMLDLMLRYGRPGASLLLHGDNDVRYYSNPGTSPRR